MGKNFRVTTLNQNKRETIPNYTQPSIDEFDMVWKQKNLSNQREKLLKRFCMINYSKWFVLNEQLGKKHWYI